MELEYRHPDDDTPMAGAPYRARFADGSVRAGRLGADGTARLDGLPPALAGTAVEVTFGEVPDDYRALPGDETPNPDFGGSETAFDDTRLEHRPQLAAGGPLMAVSMAGLTGLGLSGASFAPRVQQGVAAALDWIWGVIQGDFAENPSTSQIVAGAIVTMIPLVDQAADVRDVVANLARLRDPRERNNPGSDAYLMLATTAVGVVPVLGSPLKGALRLVVRNPQATRGALFAVLRRLGRGDPAAFAARHLSADAIYGYAQRGLGLVRGKVAAVLDGVGRLAHRFGLADLRAAVAAARRELGEIIAAARGGLRAASQKLGDLVSKAVGRGDSNARAAGGTNGRVRAQAETADPPGDGAGPTESSAGGHAGRAALPEGAVWGRLGPRLEKRTLEAPGWPDLPATQAENFTTDARAVELREGEKIYRVIDNRGGRPAATGVARAGSATSPPATLPPLTAPVLIPAPASQGEATAAYFRFALAHAALLELVAERLARGTAAIAELDDAARESMARWRDRALPLLGRDVANVRAGAREVLAGDFARASGLGAGYRALAKNLGDNFLYSMGWAGADGEAAIEAAQDDVVGTASDLARTVAALPADRPIRTREPRQGYLPPVARRVEVRFYAALAALAKALAALGERPGAARVAAGTAAIAEQARRALDDPAPVPPSAAVALPASGLAVPAGELAATLRGPLAELDAALAALGGAAPGAADARAQTAALSRALADAAAGR